VKIQQVFGKVVRRRREKVGLSQEALADKAGLHRNYIGLLERGLRTPSIEVLRKVAVGLGTTMSSLIRADKAFCGLEARSLDETDHWI
jgi:transcriptional regulator with XRE-family HTH domain